MRAAMVGGAGYVAGKRVADRRAMDQEQEERISALEYEQQAPPMQAPPPPPAPVAAAPPPPAAGGQTDLVSRLQQLASLKDQGVLSPEEFDAAKQKLLAG